MRKERPVATTFGKIAVGMGCGIPLAIILTLALIGTCGGPKQELSVKPTESAYFARKDGVQVMSGDRIVRTLQYADRLMALCGQGQCQIVGDPKGTYVKEEDILAYTPPVRIQYAVQPTIALTARGKRVRKLALGERVEIHEYDPGRSGARIGDDAWVSLATLASHRKTHEEILAEEKQAKAAEASEVMARKAYASKLRETFLDRSMDIKVSVAGANAERLMLRYP